MERPSVLSRDFHLHRVLLLCVFVLACNSNRPETKLNPQAERRHAFEIANAFCKTLETDDNLEQKALTTRAFQQRQAKSKGILTGLSNFTFLIVANLEESSSPDGEEWIFSGWINKKSDSANTSMGTFKVRVTKESDSGKWRVDFFNPVIKKP